MMEIKICKCCDTTVSKRSFGKHLIKRTYKNKDGTIAKENVTPCNYKHGNRCKEICMRNYSGFE